MCFPTDYSVLTLHCARINLHSNCNVTAISFLLLLVLLRLMFLVEEMKMLVYTKDTLALCAYLEDAAEPTELIQHFMPIFDVSYGLLFLC